MRVRNLEAERLAETAASKAGPDAFWEPAWVAVLTQEARLATERPRQPPVASAASRSGRKAAHSESTEAPTKTTTGGAGEHKVECGREV
eukprot:4261130-Pleurochrysis_carterae.AAC.2